MDRDAYGRCGEPEGSGEDSTRSRRNAIDALGRIGAADNDSAAIFEAALRDADPGIRAAAVGPASRLGTDFGKTMTALCGMLKDTDSAVRLAVLRALTANVAGALEAGPGLYREMVVPAMAEATADPDPKMRIEAVQALGLVAARDASPVAALAKKLADEEPSVRIAAAVALGGARREDLKIFRAALEEAKKDGDEGVRKAADEAMNRLSPPGR